MKLVTSEGRELAVTLSPISRGTEKNCLPKKAPKVDGTLNGMPYSFAVTSNKGWAKSPELVLEYLWFDVDGKAYYVTLNYAESAASMKGTEFVTADGSGPAPAKRVTADQKSEDSRVERFKKTWKERS